MSVLKLAWALLIQTAMKSPLLALGLCALLMPCAANASTVLFSHTGSTNPTTEGWTRSITTSTVTGEAYDDNGTAVWKISDPGLTSGGTNLYYQAAMNATVVSNALASGWELSATISIPTNDPTSNVAWGTDSNIWLGFIGADSGGGRRYWALVFGRDASGNTRVSASGFGVTRTLDPGYHDYSLVYNPATAQVTISIDGEVWQTGYAGITAGVGSNIVYWGDNNGQTVTTSARSAYYQSVQFSIAPEPSRMLLLGAGLMMACSRRRRR